MDIFEKLVKEFEKAYETCGYASFTIKNENFFSYVKIPVETLETDENSIYVVGDGFEFEIKNGTWEYNREGNGEYTLDDINVLVLSGDST